MTDLRTPVEAELIVESAEKNAIAIIEDKKFQDQQKSIQNQTSESENVFAQTIIDTQNKFSPIAPNQPDEVEQEIIDRLIEKEGVTSFDPKNIPELQNIEQNKQLYIANAIQDGYKSLTEDRIEARIKLGYAYKRIKEMVGFPITGNIVVKYWFPTIEKSRENIIRYLEKAEQLYTFYSTYKHFSKMLPLESAMAILRHVNSIKSKNAKKHFIRNINKNRMYMGVNIIHVRKLQEAFRQAKENEGHELMPDDLIFKKFARAINRSVSICNEELEILMNDMSLIDLSIQQTFSSKYDGKINDLLAKLTFSVNHMEYKLKNLIKEIQRERDSLQQIKNDDLEDDDFEDEII